MVLQDREGSTEQRSERLFCVLPWCLKGPVEQSLNDLLPMPLHLGTRGLGEQGIESVVQHRLKRLLHVLLQCVTRRATDNGLETTLEPPPKRLFRLLL
jgi:hypothetical protein